NGASFANTNTVTAVDTWNNAVASFSALGDPVTITANAPLTGTISGLGSVSTNVLDRASDFTAGVASLSTLGMTYTGNAATGTFTATSQTGKTGTSAAVAVAPGPVSAAVSTVGSSAATVTADGSATATITVTLEDASGNP